MYLHTADSKKISGKELYNLLSGQGRVEVEKQNLTEANTAEILLTL
jgi:hypothetical protein